MDRQTELQGIDNEAGILSRDIPNTLGANSQDPFVPEPFGSGTYPFETFSPQLPDFTQTQASDWIAYEPDRVKDTTLPMLDDPKLESEAAEALNNLFSEKAAPTPLSTDSVNSDAIIEKDENIQQEDQSSHSRRKRFVGDIIIPGSLSSSFIVEVKSIISESNSERKVGSCTGSRFFLISCG